MSFQEAVFILHEHEVVAGYRLKDFEQQVRQGASLTGPSGDYLCAAYVQIGNHQCAEAIVLFQLPVQCSGEDIIARPDWYMPLQRLADNAGPGPNMGAGRIRLACQSQCSVSWHRQSLWEPATSDFMAIRKALRDSSLVQQPLPAAVAPVAADSSPLSAVQRVSGASTGSLLAQKHDDPEVEALKRMLRNEVDTYRKQLQQLQQEIERQRSLNEALQRQTEQAESGALAAQQAEELKQRHAHQLSGYQQQIELLQAELELARLDAETS